MASFSEGPEVESLSVIVGQSLKVTLDELSEVTDWSSLVVTLGDTSLATWSRRTNSLYFKGVAEGETMVSISFEGTERKTFKLIVTAQ